MRVARWELRAVCGVGALAAREDGAKVERACFKGASREAEQGRRARRSGQRASIPSESCNSTQWQHRCRHVHMLPPALECRNNKAGLRSKRDGPHRRRWDGGGEEESEARRGEADGLFFRRASRIQQQKGRPCGLSYWSVRQLSSRKLQAPPNSPPCRSVPPGVN